MASLSAAACTVPSARLVASLLLIFVLTRVRVGAGGLEGAEDAAATAAAEYGVGAAATSGDGLALEVPLVAGAAYDLGLGLILRRRSNWSASAVSDNLCRLLSLAVSCGGAWGEKACSSATAAGGAARAGVERAGGGRLPTPGIGAVLERIGALSAASIDLLPSVCPALLLSSSADSLER